MKKILLPLVLIVSTFTIQAQGYFTGGLQLNSDFYVRDSAIAAVNTPHYDNLKSSTDSWLDLNYINDDLGFEAGIRLDMFLNSNLHTPGIPYNGYGIGRWYLSKRFEKAKITGGYIYDQFGSGIIFRSYEDRGLGIDNSLLGAKVEYDLTDNLKVKALAGVQKNRFDLYSPFIKGLNMEGYAEIGDNLSLIPGGSVLNRTLDQNSMGSIVSTIETYDKEDRFVPVFNMYSFGLYNTLNYKNFSWYIEGAYKTEEAITDGTTLFNSDGTVLYTSLTYSKKGIGATMQFKRTENFPMRTSPNETLLNGFLNFVPPTARQNSYRLLSRYNAATQELEESAASLDITWTPKKGYTTNISVSNIMDNKFESVLFQELYVDLEIKKSKKIKPIIGFQYIMYNQAFYEGAGKPTDVVALSPFIDVIYKIDRKKSLKMELQYQHVDKDFGQWMYGSLEFNLAPKWSLAVSDMWNFKPNPKNVYPNDKAHHYYSIFTSYNWGSSRFSLSYVKQVEGIVCTGGVCRFEPAFSGVKFGLTTSF